MLTIAGVAAAILLPAALAAVRSLGYAAATRDDVGRAVVTRIGRVVRVSAPPQELPWLYEQSEVAIDVGGQTIFGTVRAPLPPVRVGQRVSITYSVGRSGQVYIWSIAAVAAPGRQ